MPNEIKVILANKPAGYDIAWLHFCLLILFLYILFRVSDVVLFLFLQNKKLFVFCLCTSFRVSPNEKNNFKGKVKKYFHLLENELCNTDPFIHTTHASSPKRYRRHLRYSFETPTFYQNYLAKSNTTEILRVRRKSEIHLLPIRG
jgi:hypothetical protein